MRTCSKCGEPKPGTAEFFHADKRNVSGFTCRCRACTSTHHKAKYAADADRRRAAARDKYAANPDKARATMAKWRAANPDKDRAWAAKNPDRVKAIQERWRVANLDKVNAKTAKARARNPLRYTVSTMVWLHLKRGGGRKAAGTFVGLLGYTSDDLRAHLESQFRAGMSWENYGTAWEIDHKTPLCSLPASSAADENFRKAWALQNLQPLPPSVNRSKGGRVLELTA